MDMIGRIRRLHGRKKKSEREIARITGLSRNTVAKWLHGEVDGPPKYRRGEQPNKLTRIPRRAQAGAEGRRAATQARASHGQGAVRRDQGRRLRRRLHARDRLHPGVAPGRRRSGVDQRLHTAGLRARRGVPVRLERGRLVVGGIYYRAQVSHMKLCARGRSGWWPTRAKATRCCSMPTRAASPRSAAWPGAASTTT